MHRGWGLALLLPTLASVACSDAQPVTIELWIADRACDLPCGTRYLSEAFMVEGSLDDDPGSEGDPIGCYTDVETSSGALAVLELTQRTDRALSIRYREVTESVLSFRGTTLQIVDDVHRNAGEPPLFGSFLYRGIDHERGTEREVRGKISPRVVDTEPPPSGGAGGGDGSDVDVQVGIYVGPHRRTEDSGCDDPAPASDSGCDDCGDSAGSAADGCGDAADSCDGCEGDAAASSCDGCDGCEGDFAARGSQRAMAGVVRLSWPVVLVGWVNRRLRRRD